MARHEALGIIVRAYLIIPYIQPPLNIIKLWARQKSVVGIGMCNIRRICWIYIEPYEFGIVLYK